MKPYLPALRNPTTVRTGPTGSGTVVNPARGVVLEAGQPRELSDSIATQHPCPALGLGFIRQGSFPVEKWVSSRSTSIRADLLS